VGHFERKCLEVWEVAHQGLLETENKSPWAITWRCLREPVFSRFGTVPACHRLTDRQTDGHMMTANTRASVEI